MYEILIRLKFFPFKRSQNLENPEGKKACLCLLSFTICCLWFQNRLLRFAVPFERASHPDLLLLPEVALCP